MQTRDTEFDVGEPDLAIARIDSLERYLEYLETRRDELERRLEVERALLRPEKEFYVSGDCWACGKPSRFLVTHDLMVEIEGIRMPNWRESLRCGGCLLNSRMRASVHLFERLLAPKPETRIYLTEQVGDVHPHLRAKYPRLVGSEYFPGRSTPPAAWVKGLRHEDLRGLSFEPESLDAILSFDVLEHVPNHTEALAELLRVLRPGGRMLFSVPFLPRRRETIVRARLEEDGTVTHLLPPEYHGDPLRPDGCLAFHHFAWELLDEMRATGFSEVSALFYWSRRFGYLGRNPCFFLAVK